MVVERKDDEIKVLDDPECQGYLQEIVRYQSKKVAWAEYMPVKT